ncbi:hypothetical protein TEA_013682 [Camellia sinensis var. sinensis]|uniref:Phorbol-ester/DAG-type domain-containing protein n=2 Tax=Camellia sinensis TaxID=4442 RepID=A0A4V3WLL6_CAMSN|nr:hypothetical protein TEA_013682 [Camellia sinensis var. sinensis]
MPYPNVPDVPDPFWPYPVRVQPYRYAYPYQVRTRNIQMGFGDSDDEHPLRRQWTPKEGVVCFRCDLPPSECEPPMSDRGYGCTRCNYFTHKLCAELPANMMHPIHGGHLLTLLPSPPSNCSSTICNDCGDSCHGYIYHCATCEFNLHLKCFLTLKHENHQHPLRLCKLEAIYTFGFNCIACGYPADGFTFGCDNCEFFIHHECAFIPPSVKHHHRHVLTLTYTFPEESDQVYCDVCEEEAGPPPQHLEYWHAGREKKKHDSESNKSLYYYYCKGCDYIAHVFCVTQVTRVTRLKEEGEKEEWLEHFSHLHPLSFSRKVKDFQSYCSGCGRIIWDLNNYCNQCNFVLHKSCAEFPRLIKHQLHEHSLTLCDTAPCDDGRPVMCNSCDERINGFNFRCADCKFTLHLVCARTFLHPSHEHNLVFDSEPRYSTGMFRCDACGELGQGFGMHCTHNCNFDLHMECFALPGGIKHECHPHPLSLASSPTAVSDKSHCEICDKEVDPELWIYHCEECDYISHLICVASDLLRSWKASNAQPNFHTILSCEEASIKAPEMPPLCYYLSGNENMPLRPHIPLFISPDALKLLANENDDEPANPNITDLAITQTNDDENNTMTVHWISSSFQHSGHNHPLTPLDEPFDEIYCLICKLVIFPPSYSCAQCQIFLHKSCAELPQKYPSHLEHTFTLVPPPFGESSSTCNFCKKPITSYAYSCTCEVILDVQCAFGVPIMKHKHHKHHFFCSRFGFIKCRACGKPVSNELVPSFNCGQVGCDSSIHAECALLPYTITHRIHRRHSLELISDLNISEEFYCDVCETEVNPKLWAYHCYSCDASDHVDCVISRKRILQDVLDASA